MSDKLKILETFPNAYPTRDYTITHVNTEFTSVCPKTGHPDFATMILEYVPDQTCIELKSLKLYYQSYRNDGIYYEAVTNKILEDLVSVCAPRYMKITAEFGVRGGISSVIEAEHFSPEFYEEAE
jgi:7-cyano-7-deazaguanine reductase